MKFRIFIAFPVSDEIKKELQKIQNELVNINKNARVKWTFPSAWHVTTQFLGEIEERQVEKIKIILSNLASKHCKFLYYLDDIDGFPNKNNPNVIIIKIQERGREGYNLQEHISNGLKSAGINFDDKIWIPHITLGRNRGADKICGLSDVKVEPFEWKIDKIELIKSELLPDGPKYTLLKNYELENTD